MTTPEPGTKPYKRIGGRGKSLAGSSTLWEGDDHLMLAEVAGYVETYKRFYYRDIQAFIVQVNRQRFFGNVILLAAAAIVLLPVFSYPDTAPICGSIAGFFLLLSLIHSLGGSACKTRIVTAVNVQPLPMLGRVRSAEKAFRRLLPRIESAQGRLEDAAELMQAFPPEAAEAPVAPHRAASGSATDTRPASLRYHKISCGVLGVLTLAFVLHVLFHNAFTAVFESIALLVLLVASVMALVRQTGHLVFPPLRKWTWWLLGYEIAVYTVVYIFIIVASMDVKGDEVTPYQSLLRSIVDMEADGVFSPFTFHLCAAAAGLVFFMAGLALLQAAGRAPMFSTPPPPPPPIPRQEPAA